MNVVGQQIDGPHLIGSAIIRTVNHREILNEEIDHFRLSIDHFKTQAHFGGRNMGAPLFAIFEKAGEELAQLVELLASP